MIPCRWAVVHKTTGAILSAGHDSRAAAIDAAVQKHASGHTRELPWPTLKRYGYKCFREPLEHDEEMKVLADELTSMRHISKSGCWEYVGKTMYGYGVMTYKRRTRGVHRIAAMVWLGMDIESRLFVCHKCDNRRCFNPDHFFLGDAQDNMGDASRKMRLPQAKLTPAQAVEIYKRVANGELTTNVSREYGVSRATVGSIKSGQSWWHITKELPRPAHWSKPRRNTTSARERVMNDGE